MSRCRFILPALAIFAVAGTGQAGEGAAPTPAFVAADHAVVYHGPGREEPAPEGLTSVDIGYFGPGDDSASKDVDLWRGAVLAVEQANSEGGHDGLPFRLVPVESSSPWGTGVRDLTRLAFTGGVWALVGGVDGAATHLAEQVVVKARLPLLNPASTDRTVNLANVPWLFSLSPADDVLLAGVVERVAGEPFALISATDHDSRAATVEFYRRLSSHGVGPRRHLEIRPTDPEVRQAVGHVVDAEVTAVVVLAGAADSARIVRAIRDRSQTIRVFGGASMGRSGFLKQAGPAAEGVVFSSPCPPASLDGPVAQSFRERFGSDPDCAALQTYDSVRLLVAGLRRSGLNRARLGDALRELSPWSGASGPVDWDPLGHNLRPASPATVRGGKVRVLR